MTERARSRRKVAEKRHPKPVPMALEPFGVIQHDQILALADQDLRTAARCPGRRCREVKLDNRGDLAFQTGEMEL